MSEDQKDVGPAPGVPEAGREGAEGVDSGAQKPQEPQQSRRQLKKLRRLERREGRRLESEARGQGRKKSKRLRYIALTVLIIAAVYIFANIIGGYHSQPAISAHAVVADTGDLMAKGDPNAPVTITEYGDYQCPFCKRFHDTILPDIEREYISTGKARLVFKDFPLVSIHPYAFKASEAALCAGEQGKFWEMHDKLFASQHDLSISSIKAYAGQIGLEPGKFGSCLDSGRMASKVSATMAEGSAAGVSGTPGFVVNGQLFSGVLPIASWRQLVESNS